MTNLFDFKNFTIFKEEFINSSSNSTFNVARIVTGETPKFDVADVQRRFTPRSEDDSYSFPTRYGRYKFRKDGIFPSVKNRDGVHHTISKASSLDEVRSLFINSHSYSDLFQTPLGDLFPDTDYNITMLERNYLNIPLDELKNHSYESSPLQVLEHDTIKNTIWFSVEAIEWLKEFFGVSNVYRLQTFVSNDQVKSIVNSSATLLHINHFGGVNKKEITHQEHKGNITCLFWLFDDILVVTPQDGKCSW